MLPKKKAKVDPDATEANLSGTSQSSTLYYMQLVYVSMVVI